MLTEIKDPEKLKKIAAEAVIKYADQIEINRKLQSRLAAAEAECAIYYEIAAAAIGEEQTIALRDAAMRRRRCRDGTVTICTEILSSDVQHERTQ